MSASRSASVFLFACVLICTTALVPVPQQCSVGWCGSHCQECCPGYGGASCLPCSIRVHCNNHADSIDPTTCACTCSTGYGGTDCGQCATGYVGYSSGQCRRCDGAVQCNGHGTAAPDPLDPDRCVCTCTHPWTGSTCATCPDNYEQTTCASCHADAITLSTAPLLQCSARCAVQGLCPPPLGVLARKVTVPGTANETCSCQCATNVGGLVPPVLCDRCSPGYIYQPPVVPLTSPTQCRSCTCSGRGTVVSSDGVSTCDCACTGFWGPPQSNSTVDACSLCAPGGNRSLYDSTCSGCSTGRLLPSGCATTCDEVCGAMALPVPRAITGASSTDITQSSCRCKCATGYTGPSCMQCDTGFHLQNATNSSVVCERCTQTKVVQRYGQPCVNFVALIGDGSECGCQCMTGFAGPTCGRCDDAQGYFGYPNCRQCSVSSDCAGRALTVTYNPSMSPTPCQCECTGQWAGRQCTECDSRFDPTTCAQCGVQRIGYPTCAPCTCTNRALSITTNVDHTKCLCECTRGTTCRNGPPCENCDICDIAAGFVHVGMTGAAPENCTQCTNEQWCNGHASSVRVSDDGSQCVCTCQSGYTGPNCEKCASGFVSYPNCAPCSVSGSCQGHATDVVAALNPTTGATTCTCQCRNQWTGSSCATCPERYETSADCGRCAVGYVNYPACVECTASDCGGNFSSGTVYVTSNADRTQCVCGCECTATRCTTGPRCQQCASGYAGYPTCAPCTLAASCNSSNTLTVSSDPLTDTCTCGCVSGYTGSGCGQCATLHHGYPACVPCDISYCGGTIRAAAVVAGTSGGCACVCRGQWTASSQCTVCPSQYDSARNCEACAAGRVSYPTCEVCDAAVHCNSRGTVRAAAGQGSCLCTCDTGYTGSRCEACAEGFVIGSSPVGGGLTCTACSNTVHCSGNAVAVTSDASRLNCQCTCRLGFAGQRCNTCAEGFRGANATGGPPCYACTAGDCSYRATAVAARGSECVCTCAAPWTGFACQNCGISNSAGGQCQACADGFTNFPLCDRCAVGYVGSGSSCRRCTVTADCGSIGISVTSDATNSFCVCQCPVGRTGTACADCAPGYIPNAVGGCDACSTFTHCSGRAVAVSSANGQCVCTCQAQYGGTMCQSCASGYRLPGCTACTGSGSCNNRSYSVSVSADQTQCVCACMSGYEGLACEQCASGWIGWPNCVQCTSASNCNDRAVGPISSNVARTQCVCDTCRGEWTGAQCGVCPIADCDACPVGFVGRQPLCRQCTVSADCLSSYAVSVTTSNGECVCQCREGYTGQRCGSCAAGYVGFPACRRCDVQSDCSGRASAVAESAAGTCQCACLSPWIGAACDICPLTTGGTGTVITPNGTLVVASACPPCGYGQVGLPPLCRTCTTTTDCNGNAVSVGVDSSGQQCTCQCAAAYTGAGCQQCAVGYYGYPICGPCSSAGYCHGVGSAVFAATTVTCECVCGSAHQGERCEACAAGRLHYPTCTESPYTGRDATDELSLTACFGPTITGTTAGTSGNVSTSPLAVATGAQVGMETLSPMRNALQALVDSPGVVGMTRAPVPLASVGPACRQYTFVVHNLAGGQAGITEEALTISVATDASFRQSVGAVGNVSRPAAVPAPPAVPMVPRAPEEGMFGVDWLSPGLFGLFVVLGVLGIVLAAVAVGLTVWYLSRAQARKDPQNVYGDAEPQLVEVDMGSEE
eukprot:TRINITY_DN32863_c0_g1_i1.p1 TRINITY_DN32863_c0_g1~~TRINITY_DN32863_c0_g1_i1.p1  ORF type:complete len:1695 (+),score=209.29 TRINITY_DN32863_c0_g1_i1:184-5268(+)